MRLDVAAGNDIFLTYTTPILNRQWPDAEALNAGLHRILLAREQAHPEYRTGQINRSNLGGWRSEPDLLDWPEPEIGQLRRMIGEAVMQFMQLTIEPARRHQRLQIRPSMAAWANINRDGSYNIVHNHPGQHLSGVYYVTVGEPDPAHPMNGTFEFHDPRPAAEAMPVPGFDFGSKQTFQPQPGMMLLFPSWHKHMVHPFRGAGERISIAFNVLLREVRLVEAAARQPGRPA